MTITFESLNESHFALLLEWLELPIVKKWWDQDITYTPALIREKFSKHTHGMALSENLNNKIYAYIICSNGQKIGYIQTYSAREFEKSNCLDLSSISGSICGVDLFISDSNLLNKGIGPQILNKFEEQILYPHFDFCLIDPAKDNIAAIKAFGKAGYKVEETLRSESSIWMIKKLF